MAQVALQNVTKHYGQVAAVRNLTLEIPDHEFVVLVGPSGCGKSTILRLVAGLESPSSGEIAIGGQRVNEVPARQRDVAMVFQNYALYPHLDVYENMAFGLRLRRVPAAEIRRRVQATAEMLGLAHLLRRKPREMSGGQRQRVALGRAIVRDPRVFLMDEPLSNLDARLRVQMRLELSQLHQQLRTTTVYVTHDQVEAMTMGDRIAVLHDGRIQQVATPAEVYDRPANLFVAGFIGSPPMNLVPGRLQQEGETLLFTAAGMRVPLAAGPAGRPQREVVLGIRPEGVLVAGGHVDGCPEPRIATRVERVESLGAEAYLYLRAGEVTLTARAGPGLRPRAGDHLAVTLATDQVHLFDPVTQAALRPEAGRV